MEADYADLKTDAELLARLRRAALHEMTAGELWRQRVSFVYGEMAYDSPLTKSDVEAVLARHYGCGATALP